ncbi:hypothetical protein C4D60_Mb08t31290 [Musa balbisiana]|uniref:Uncharacterized protein n=1 Tax=Musa balbisiana TaxID=52838 RepID=A0A4S8K7U7_MUSBA|nr:hypothetical protein C4D60_Mb08t31290 [Musa balbisiana]
MSNYFSLERDNHRRSQTHVDGWSAPFPGPPRSRAADHHPSASAESSRLEELTARLGVGGAAEREGRPCSRPSARSRTSSSVTRPRSPPSSASNGRGDPAVIVQAAAGILFHSDDKNLREGYFYSEAVIGNVAQLLRDSSTSVQWEGFGSMKNQVKKACELAEACSNVFQLIMALLIKAP